jgi:hypothetical protein
MLPGDRFAASRMVGSISNHVEHIVSSGKPFQLTSLFGMLGGPTLPAPIYRKPLSP